ncbi:MAG: hypothetical protein MZV49_03590 [Rhodopseudomonas palustris]|nr:hypothetical protein [Rhodopseudomonas palustris]
MFCYRRYGHNEGDEPMLHPAADVQARSPAIRPTLAALRRAAGRRRRRSPQDEVDDMQGRLPRAARRRARGRPSYRPNKADWLDGTLGRLQVAPSEDDRAAATPASRSSAARRSAARSPRVPDGFDVHRTIAALCSTAAAR